MEKYMKYTKVIKNKEQRKKTTVLYVEQFRDYLTKSYFLHIQNGVNQ